MKSLLALWFLLLFASCSILSPQQRATARLAVEQSYADGALTQEQYEVAIAALDADEPVDWEALGYSVAGIALAILGVNSKIPLIGRGARTQVHGLPASKVTTQA